MMGRGLAFALCALVWTGSAEARVVRTGSIVEAKYGIDSVKTLADEALGDRALLFVGPWTAEKIRAVGDCCRARGLRFSMDEMFDRLTGDWKEQYRPIRAEVLKAIGEYRDVFDGTQHQSESGGVLFYWPFTNSLPCRVPAAKTYSEAFAAVGRQLSEDLAAAKAGGLVPPYFTIECGAFGCAAHLLRAGWDRVDLEVVYSDELERQYAGAKTAAEAYGRDSFGTDMAMIWYGGIQEDSLREHRWRTSLYHAYLRGADPIYNEHGLMDWRAHGHAHDRDHPSVVRYRRVLADFARWVKAHPRAEGYPRAAVGAIYGRCDGYAGVFQTHVFGQRTNELFRVSETDAGWRMFDGLYRRRTWQDRDRWGDADYSGNPPLGAAGILPFDAADAEFAKYRFLFFLGRNVMDETLYAKLVRYVHGGGTLLLTASHLDSQDVPKGPFKPYNGGDWTELVGVKVGAGNPTRRLPHGLKFVRNPDANWKFQPLTNFCDPDFTDGGFDVPALTATTAEPLAVSSTQFVESDLSALMPVLFVNRVGRGKVIFLASIDSPGAPGVRRLYEFLLAKAMEAEGRDIWPKVECSDMVRWSVYRDGTIYLLNTENRLAQEAIVRRTLNGFAETVRLRPGEFRILDGAKFPLADLHCELDSAAAYRSRLAVTPPRPHATNCTASVRRVGGFPRLAINGKPMSGTCVVPGARVPCGETEFSIRDFAANSLQVAGNLLMSKGVSLTKAWWVDEDVYDFEKVDAAFAAAICGMPEGWVFPRVSLDPPNAWIARHPEEMRAGEVRPDSAAWRTLYRRMLTNLVTHVETSPYAAHVMGYQVGALHGNEWLIHPWPRDEIPAEAQDPRDPLPPLDGNPRRRAYTRKCSGDIASALLDAAQTVKRLTGGRKLVGAFFGYLHTNGQQDMARVIASPDVDFFASPASYAFRLPGQAAPLQASLTASFGLHGKVFFEEADVRTLYARTDAPYRMPDLFQSVNAIRRSVGYALAGGREIWWFLLAGNDTFHDERIMEAVRIGHEESRRTLASAPYRRPDVGVFFRPDDYSSCSQSPCEPLCKDLRYHLFRTILPTCGVGFDAYQLSDIAHPDLPDYKVYVFPNAFELTEAERAAIKRTVRRKGKSAIWIMAPGYYRNGSGNAANAEDLTGISIAENYPVATGRYSRTFRVTDAAGAVKDRDGWRSVYLAKPPARDEMVAALRAAGAHFWTEPGDVIAAGRGYLMYCAATEGKKRIALPERCDVAEIYGNAPLRRDVLSFEEPFRLGEVRVYRMKGK